MKNPILLALIPVALCSVAAKGGCGGATEDPIVLADASTSDANGIGDCPIPEPTCPAGSTYSVAGCKCVENDACAPLPCPSNSTFNAATCSCETKTCAPLPCPSNSTFNATTCSCVNNACLPTSCPNGTTVDPNTCLCVATADASTPSDCPIPLPATSPFNVYIQGIPAGAKPSDFTVSAKGSAGDTVTLAYDNTLSDGSYWYAGQGGSSESYELTIVYPHATPFTSTVNWSVAGCGFTENFDVATGTHSP
jgi:hypothetical protein